MNGDIDRVLEKYPRLELRHGNVLFGEVTAYAEIDDRYSVEIDVSGFPKRFPRVFETNQRIPRIADRHCNTDGSLCFTTQAKQEVLLATRIRTVMDFIDLMLIPYLQNNSYYEVEKKYWAGEHAHDPMISDYESYSELLAIKDPALLGEILTKLRNGFRINPNQPCYCGSRIKIKHCANHRKLFTEAKTITHATLEKGIANLEKFNVELKKYIARKSSS